MTVEIRIKPDIDGAILTGVTHVSYSDDMSELLIHHKKWVLSVKRGDIDYFVVRGK